MISGIDFLQKIKISYKESVEVIMLTVYGSIETNVQTIKMRTSGYFIIGEMELSTQITWLHVIETKQMERIGSNRWIDVAFRLVSTTNHNLYQAVKEGRFREDFLY